PLHRRAKGEMLERQQIRIQRLVIEGFGVPQGSALEHEQRPSANVPGEAFVREPVVPGREDGQAGGLGSPVGQRWQAVEETGSQTNNQPCIPLSWSGSEPLG